MQSSNLAVMTLRRKFQEITDLVAKAENEGQILDKVVKLLNTKNPQELKAAIEQSEAAEKDACAAICTAKQELAAKQTELIKLQQQVIEQARKLANNKELMTKGKQVLTAKVDSCPRPPPGGPRPRPGGPPPSKTAVEARPPPSGPPPHTLQTEELPSSEVLCDHKTAVEIAIKARDTRRLPRHWTNAARRLGRGSIPANPLFKSNDFLPSFQTWLRQRGLTNTLQQESDREVFGREGYKVFKLVGNKLTPQQEQEWALAYHGTRCYALWSILFCGSLLESFDMEAGHNFLFPGTYCTPRLRSAWEYAIPHVLFDDGVYYRVVLELRVNISERIESTTVPDIVWSFPQHAVAIRAIWVLCNAPPGKGEERFDTWKPLLEAVPECHARPTIGVKRRRKM